MWPPARQLRGRGLPAGPRQLRPHWLHVSLETRHRGANTGCRMFPPPRPLPHTAMKDLFTSQKQACWQEHIRKETAARVAWNLNHGHKHPEGALPRKRPQKAPFRSVLGAGPSQATSAPDSKEVPAGWPETRGLQGQLSRGVGVQGPAPKVDRGWQAQKPTRGPADQTKPVGSGMRQVPPSTLQLLFQGVSHDGQGRASYLRERYQQKPEQKFLYPIVSSWEYGWHMGEAMKDTKPPTYARFQPITKSFYIKSNIFHVSRRTDQLM